MLVFCFWLKLHVQIGLEDLVFVERVDPDVGDAAGAERFIRAAAVAVTEALLTADVEGVKAVAVAAVVVEDRRDLEINVLREIELRADLPREEPGVGVRHEPAAGHSPGSERVLGIRIVVDELREVDEEIKL